MFDIDRDYLKPKRNNTTTKEEVYMLHALSAASNSKDPSTQVGACYVSEDERILGIGCNQTPNLWDEDTFPWGTNKEYGVKNIKYTYVIHAEMAALVNSKCTVDAFDGSTLYVTLFPCSNCANLIASLKVKKVVYLNARKDIEDFICSNILLKKAGVECIDFKEIDSVLNIEFDLNKNEKNNIKIMRKKYQLKH